jgi:hypothetical protein
MATLGFLKELSILIVAYNCITTHPRSIVRLLAQLSRCTMLFEHECQLRREVSLRHFYGYTCVFQGSVYFDSTIHMLHHELEIDGSRGLTFLDLGIHLLYADVTQFSKWISHFAYSLPYSVQVCKDLMVRGQTRLQSLRERYSVWFGEYRAFKVGRTREHHVVVLLCYTEGSGNVPYKRSIISRLRVYATGA